MTELSLHRPCALARVPRFDLETDVIVVGFGAAGACAAIEAAHSGVRVALFEAAARGGGTSALSGGEIYLGGGGGTPIQRAAGFTDETEELFRYLVMAGGPNADEAKARLYADGSLAHFHWLCAQGVQYKTSYISGKIVEPVSQYILQQPGDRIWLLADQGTYGSPEFQQLARIEIGAAGETWEEVEQELGLPRGTLVDTVAVYNHYAALGDDPLFHKAAKWLKPLDEPPFVALDCRIDHCFYSSFTLGGLDTAPTGEVLNEDREVIPGLYAAGRTACGLPRWGPGYSSGMSLADATFFGRQAGLRAARSSLRSES